MKVMLNEFKKKLISLNKMKLLSAKTPFILLYFFFIVSCHSYDPIEPVKEISVSRSYLKFFDRCYPSEGGGRIILEKEKTPLAEARLDWVARDHKSWHSQLSDPFGMILLEQKWRKRPPSFSQEGKLVNQIPNLKINNGGFWEADGIMIGLKAEEVPCLLEGKFPIAWRDMIYKKEESKIASTFYISESARKVEITFSRSNNKLNKACALFLWKHFFGMRTGRINWCIANSHKKSELEIPGNHTIKWEKSDE